MPFGVPALLLGVVCKPVGRAVEHNAGVGGSLSPQELRSLAKDLMFSTAARSFADGMGRLSGVCRLRSWQNRSACLNIPYEARVAWRQTQLHLYLETPMKFLSGYDYFLIRGYNLRPEKEPRRSLQVGQSLAST